jgi:secreted trypsin-like serine protease
MLGKLIFIAIFALASASYDKTKFAAREAELFVPKDTQEFIKEVGGGGRISNGGDASDIAYPYAVEVTTRWRTGEISTCTGSIISTSYVITSRTCIL